MYRVVLPQQYIPQSPNNNLRQASGYAFRCSYCRRQTVGRGNCYSSHRSRLESLGVLGNAIFGAGNIPSWYAITFIPSALGGISLPLVVCAWLGAAALSKYAGLVGLLLVFGIGTLAFSKHSGDRTLWARIGISSLVVSMPLFFYIGFQVKVPIWL